MRRRAEQHENIHNRVNCNLEVVTVREGVTNAAAAVASTAVVSVGIAVPIIVGAVRLL